MHREKQRCQEKVSVKSERQKDREGRRDQGHKPKRMEPGTILHGPEGFHDTALILDLRKPGSPQRLSLGSCEDSESSQQSFLPELM